MEFTVEGGGEAVASGGNLKRLRGQVHVAACGDKPSWNTQR